MPKERISLDLMHEFLSDRSVGGEFPHEKQPREHENLALRELLNDNLTKKQKCYIILYYRDGLTMEEIAKRFGVAKSTVSRTIYRGRERLLAGASRQAMRKILG